MMPLRPSSTGRFLTAAVLLIGLGAAALAAAPAKKDAPAPPKKEAPKKDEPNISAPHAILIDGESGSVLFARRADDLIFPASLAKLMTAEYVFNELKEGRIKLTDEYRVSTDAWRRGGAPSHGSTMFAAINSKVSVDALLRGMIVQSANDACIILAEGLADTELEFGIKLTDRAREIGLAKSVFTNSNGLPDPREQVTTRELAILARHIILNYPEFYKIFGQPDFTWNKIRQPNRNPLLGMSVGADGLKTGFTKEAGYGLVGSAVQNGLRLIVVVNGLKSAKERADEAKKLLEWGFRNFEPRTLFAEGQIIGSAKVYGGASGQRAAAGARDRAGHDPEERRRKADRAHRLYRPGAGAGHAGPADRRAQSMARRRPGLANAAQSRRGRRQRQYAPARPRCHERNDHRAVPRRGPKAMIASAG